MHKVREIKIEEFDEMRILSLGFNKIRIEP
jgi:hypothetical protein